MRFFGTRKSVTGGENSVSKVTNVGGQRKNVSGRFGEDVEDKNEHGESERLTQDRVVNDEEVRNAHGVSETPR